MFLRKKQEKVKKIQKLSKFYSLEELNEYYSVEFQKLVSMKDYVEDRFFCYMLKILEKRYKWDYKQVSRTERREFRVNKVLYADAQKRGEIDPYSFKNKPDSSPDLSEQVRTELIKLMHENTPSTACVEGENSPTAIEREAPRAEEKDES